MASSLSLKEAERVVLSEKCLNEEDPVKAEKLLKLIQMNEDAQRSMIADDGEVYK